MAYFIVLQNTYSHVEVALGRDDVLVRHTVVSKTDASSHITLVIDTLLKEEHISLDELTFLAAHVGPAPFTTLRVVIATVNGLGFATQKPLIAIDGLAVFLDEYAASSDMLTIALFNAFNQDVYVGIDAQPRLMTCMKIPELVNLIQSTYAHKKIRLIGSGVLTYRDQLQQLSNIEIPTPLPEHSSLSYLVARAWQQWNNKSGIADQLQPLYLKKAI